MSLRPSESLGALRQVDWALAFVLDCLDGRALASVEMTSVALECSARAAASRRAQGNIYAMLLAVELGLDPDALGARYLAATTEELIQALFRPQTCAQRLTPSSTRYSAQATRTRKTCLNLRGESPTFANIRARAGAATTGVRAARPSRRRRARASRSRRRGRRRWSQRICARMTCRTERSDGDRCPEFAGPESLAVEPGFDPGRVVVPANLRNVLSVPAPARRLRGFRGWRRVPPEAAPRRAGAVSGKRRRDRLVDRRVVPRAPHRRWTLRAASSPTWRRSRTDSCARRAPEEYARRDAIVAS